MSADKLSAMGWAPRIGLEDGIAETYRWFLEHDAKGKAA
jgi:GDP-L-fucose synthase